MARRPTNPPAPQRAVLTVDQMQRAIPRIQKRIDDLQAFDLSCIQSRGAPEVRALETSIETTLSNIFGPGSVEHKRYSGATTLDRGPYVVNQRASAQQAQQYVEEGIVRAVLLLQQAIQGLQEEIEEQGYSATAPAPESVQSPVLNRRIFIVHGHEDGARETVARFVEKIGFEAVILHEQANRGRTIIEKVEAHSDVGFAVILLTPDDEGRKKATEELLPRPRQNVLLELGYFIGKLGRENVAAFKSGEMEIPTDFAGVVWEDLDAKGAWKVALGRELKAAGFEVDWNKVHE